MTYSFFSQFNVSQSRLMTALLYTSLAIGGTIVSSSNLPANSQNSASEKSMGRLFPATIPPATAQKLIQQIAKKTNQSPNQLKISAAKTAEFNGCLGIYESPNQACTMNLIYGWKVVINSPTQSFVYHLDRDANRIRQNTTASGAKPNIRVLFSPVGEISPIASNVIFSSTLIQPRTSGEIKLVLTEDGKITQYQSSPTGRFAPLLIKTLSAQQVDTFKKVLDNQRFPNLQGLSYRSNFAPKNAEMTIYQAQYGSTKFMNSGSKGLPRSLQSLIKSWNDLILPNNSPIFKLQQLLTDKNWAAADQETR